MNRVMLIAILLISGILISIFVKPIYLYGAENSEIKFELGNFSPEDRKLFSFASTLYSQKEYYRAITEFMRLNSYSNNSSLSERSAFLIAESYFKAKKIKDATNSYQEFLEKYSESKLADDSRYKLMLCQYLSGNYKEVKAIHEELTNIPDKYKWLDEVDYIYTLSLISQRKWQETISLLNKCLNKQVPVPYKEKYEELAKEIPQYTNIKRRSPRTAGLLSTVLPGSGQYYAQRPGEGIVAFILTGIFIAGAINCHQNNADVGTVVFGILGISFYSANIYNAMNSALKFNEQNEKKFHARILEIVRENKPFWSIDLEFSPDKNTLFLHYKY